MSAALHARLSGGGRSVAATVVAVTKVLVWSFGPSLVAYASVSEWPRRVVGQLSSGSPSVLLPSRPLSIAIAVLAAAVPLMVARARRSWTADKVLGATLCGPLILIEILFPAPGIGIVHASRSGRSLAVIDYVRDESGVRYLWVVDVARSNALFSVVSSHASFVCAGAGPIARLVAPAAARPRGFEVVTNPAQDGSLLILAPEGVASIGCYGVVTDDLRAPETGSLSAIDPFSLVDDLGSPSSASVREIAHWIGSCRGDLAIARNLGLPTDEGLQMALRRGNAEVRAAAIVLVDAGGRQVYPQSSDLADTLR